MTLLREDLGHHHMGVFDPGFHALAVYRLGHWALPRQRRTQQLTWKFYQLVNTLVIRNLYGTEISAHAHIGRRLRIGHHQSVMIPGCVIGDDCLIRHGVTIGMTRDGANEVAIIGQDVHFGAYSVVMGSCQIGDGARIGPHSLVSFDVPAGSTTFSNPARLLKPKISSDSGR